MQRPSIVKLELPTPYPVGPVNAYLLDGAEPALIDVGVYSSKSLAALRAQLDACGRRLEDVRRIVLTHGHYDHAGAALHLSQLCRAPLFLHEKSTLFSRRQPEMIERLFSFLAQCGAPRDLLEQAFAGFRHGGRFADLETEPFEVTPLRGGERLDLGETTLEAIATPGHCPDHLCFAAADGALFCGDMLLGRITPNPLLYLDPDDEFRRTHSLLDYLDSLDRLATLPVTRGLPGHGPEIPDFAGLIASNRAFIRSRREIFLEKARGGARTPFALAQALFGELDAANQYLAISEVVAYLDLLERDGLLTVNWEGPILVEPVES